MKKIIVIICGVILIVGLAAGCAAAPSSELAAIQSQLDEITQELESLKNAGAQEESTTQPSVSPGQDDTASAQNQTEQSGTAAGEKTVGDYAISDFEERVAALSAKMETASLQDVGTIKQEINQLERDMDTAEDQAEADFRQGILSRTDYKEVERQLEHLEDELDYAEESMEYRLGYDD